MHKSDFIINSPKSPKAIFLFAHGAGAPMDSDWMTELSLNLCEQNIEVRRFEFPYMKQRRLEGKKRPPNKAQVLIDTWHEAIKATPTTPHLFIGGKSMGGRIASLIVDTTPAKGLIALGFPLHAPKKINQIRAELLTQVKSPSLILQGERDPMGTPEDFTALSLSNNIQLKILADGDHSFKPRKKSGHTLERHLYECSLFISSFIDKNI